MRAGAALVLLCCVMGSAEAQMPAGWKLAADGPADSAASFTTMAPGWHVTTGPAAVIYQEEHRAKGRFALEMEFFSFPGTAEEGDGVFVGGDSLNGQPAFTAFVIRRDGSAGAYRSGAGGMQQLREWSKHPAVVAQHGDSVVKNVIRLAAERDSVTFLVNGAEVLKLARAAAPMDGAFGLRAGRGTNLHVSRLDMTHFLAEPRPKK